jgi:O-antigen ligase
VIVLLSASWTAAFAGYRLKLLTAPAPHQLAQLAFYGWPAVVTLWALLDRSRSTRVSRFAAAWCVAVAFALVAMPKLTSSPKDALAIPALAIAVTVATRWPALMVAIALAVSGAFGDLEVYWHFPTQKVSDLVLISLIVAVATVGLSHRRQAVAPRPLVLVLAGYLFITAVMVPLADDRSIALRDFSTGALYLVIALVIAHAGWSEGTYRRMARLALIAALVVGAYATLRIVIGPSHQEFAGNQSAFDYVNGHYRAIGSFHAPQDLGFWASAVLPFTLAWALCARGSWRFVGALATVLLAVALYGSGLRIGLIAAAAGLLATLLLYHFARAFPGLRLGLTLGAMLLAIGTGAVLFSVVHSTSPAHSYAALLHPSQDASVAARQTKWSEALRELQGRPFGYGMGTAFYLYGQQHPAVNIGSHAIDNGYLYVALEQGLVLMALFIAGLVALLVQLGRGSISTRGREAATLGIGAAGVLVSIMVSAIAEVPGETPRLLAPCVIIGLGLAQLTTRRLRPTSG